MDTLHGTACELPGVSIKFGPFMQIMRRAVELEWVRPEHAEFVAHGLRWGFDVGVRRHLLRGQRVFANYESSRVCGGVQAQKHNRRTAKVLVLVHTSHTSALWDRMSETDASPSAPNQRPRTNSPPCVRGA